MKLTIISLMYHDVVEGRGHEASGFPWPDAALYKLEPKLFDEHLRAINRAVAEKPSTINELSSTARGDAHAGRRAPWMITFDDGGVSAHTYIAGKLEEMGWRGHFFITACYIGKPAFVSPAQIRELRDRGHVIGTHSYSHPLRMAQCGWEELVWEWKMSIECLSDILGERVKTASVPGGQYKREIARAASLAGIETLFTSEPTVRPHLVDRCQVFGRYSIQRWMSPQVAAALAKGEVAPRLKQAVLWNAKKLVKAVGGEYYLKARQALAARS
jgi:peptidoglycan/xylan/chitin deacetylase (PgdA/CDA1 family)